MECTFFWICKQSRQLPWRTPRQRRIQWNCAIIYILSAVNTEKRRIQKRRLCKKDWFVLLCFFGVGAGVINVSTWTFSFWSRKSNHLPAKNKLQSAVKIIMIMIIWIGCIHTYSCQDRHRTKIREVFYSPYKKISMQICTVKIVLVCAATVREVVSGKFMITALSWG